MGPLVSRSPDRKQQFVPFVRSISKRFVPRWNLFPNTSLAKTPVIRMGRQSVLLIVGFVMISNVHCQDALDNLEPTPRLTCYECASDGCVTEDDLGVEKLCKAEAQVCFVGVGGFGREKFKNNSPTIIFYFVHPPTFIKEYVRHEMYKQEN